MSVIGYPVIRPAVSDRVAAELSAVRPKVSTVEGLDVLGRRQAVVVTQGQAATIRWIYRDTDGDPVDLSSVLDLPSGDTSSSESASTLTSSRLKLRFREALDFGASPSVDVTGSVIDSAGGEVSFQLPASAVGEAGVFNAEFAILDTSGGLLYSNTGYLIVDPGQFGVNLSHMPVLNNIRLRMRDSAPEDNFLLTVLEFDNAEIADALVRPVIWWNEAQPPIEQKFTTKNYPFAEQWMMGILACLYETAAYHYMREDVDYSAAGVSFNDKKKGGPYMQIAQQRKLEYLRWVRMKKGQLNVEAGFGGFGSAYGSIARFWRS